MAAIEIDNGMLLVRIEGADKLWALKSRLEIPLTHVTTVAPVLEGRKAWKSFRLYGTHFPGVIAAGTFRERGQTVFWDVHHIDKAIEIGLRDERYGLLVIEVDDPDAAIASIRAALAVPVS